MKKLKKVFISIGAFFTGLISKVYAANALSVEDKYGILDPGMIETKYGIFDSRTVAPKYGVFEPEPTWGERILSIGKFALPVILFIIGLCVILSKKTSQKVKIIVVSILVILAILGYVIMNYMATNGI